MPSSLFADMEGNINPDALDDQRALQLALDQLSLLGLDQEDGGASFLAGEPGPDGGGCLYPGDAGGPDGSCLFPSEAPASAKRSVNMTECVPVPSSEHVAEIVGRQGIALTPRTVGRTPRSVGRSDTTVGRTPRAVGRPARVEETGTCCVGFAPSVQ